MSASCQGTSHRRSGQALQDTAHGWVIHHGDPVFIGVLSDGAGSAKSGRYGSILACRIFLTRIRSLLKISQNIPSDSDIVEVVDAIRDGIYSVATGRGERMRDFACTFVAVIASKHLALTLHVGDGAIVGISEDESVATLSEPEHGEYASTTYFLTDSGLDGARLRIRRHLNCYRTLVLMSDGLERLALKMHDKTPFIPFFRGLCKPLDESTSQGFNRDLSEKLRTFLDSERINERTDDDKSLVIACRS